MHTYPRYAAPSQRVVVQLVRERPYAVRASALAGQAPVSSYDAMPAAPTLDYAAVHLTGDVELF